MNRVIKRFYCITAWNVIDVKKKVKNLGRFAMLETCEYWLGPVNSYDYYARQTREIYQTLPGSCEIHWVRQYLVNVVLLRIKSL